MGWVSNTGFPHCRPDSAPRHLSSLLRVAFLLTLLLSGEHEIPASYEALLDLEEEAA